MMINNRRCSMKIRELIEIASVENKSIWNRVPIDMDENLTYFSQSEGKEINILDMDIYHVARALNKSKHHDVEHIQGMLSRLKNHNDNVRILINSIEEELDNGTR
jgi:hypothetical protein